LLETFTDIMVASFDYIVHLSAGNRIRRK